MMILKLSVIAVLLVIAVSAAQSPPPSPAPTKAEKAQDVGAQSSQQSAPDWITLFTAALVLVAVVQVVVFGIQANLMRKGLALTKEAADAARDSATAATMGLHMTNRAYLHPWKWRDNITSVEQERFEVSLEFKNTGRFPATIQMIRLLRPSPLEVSSEVMVHPDFGYPFRFAVSCKPVFDDAQSCHVHNFSVLGKVRYDDGFTIRDRWFHRIYLRDSRGAEFHFPDSRFNNEREVKLSEAEDDWEKEAKVLLDS